MEQKEAESKIEKDILMYFIAVGLFSLLFAVLYTSYLTLAFLSLVGISYYGIKLFGLAISWGIVHAKKYD